MSNNLPQQIKDRIEDEAKVYAFMNYVHAGINKDADINNFKTWPFAAQVSYNSIVSFVKGAPIKFDNSATTWAERGQNLAEAAKGVLLFFEDDGKPVDGYRLREEVLNLKARLAEWNQNEKEEQA